MRNRLDFYSKEAVELLKTPPPFLIRIGTISSFLALVSFFALTYFIQIPILREIESYTYFTESDSFVVATYMRGWDRYEKVDSAQWKRPADALPICSFKAHAYYLKNDSIYFRVDKKQADWLAPNTKFVLYSHKSLLSMYYIFWINPTKDE